MLLDWIVDHGEAQVYDPLVAFPECIPHYPPVERCKRTVLPRVECYQPRRVAITHVDEGKPAASS